MDSNALSPNNSTGHTDVLGTLNEVLKQRRHAAAEESYVASLHHKGLNKILEKVGEEATETVLAAKDAELEQASAAVHPDNAAHLLRRTVATPTSNVCRRDRKRH